MDKGISHNFMTITQNEQKKIMLKIEKLVVGENDSLHRGKKKVVQIELILNPKFHEIGLLNTRQKAIKRLGAYL